MIDNTTTILASSDPKRTFVTLADSTYEPGEIGFFNRLGVVGRHADAFSIFSSLPSLSVSVRDRFDPFVQQSNLHQRPHTVVESDD